ncbi:hypothetical protein ACGFOU_36100 [Streptomyces sp. NPDC048595]|uniref:hypothetical protein n=1 Tax=Streptomyces sp. NPDC048595 TaxID=3365576 RepID=UPI0037148220
MPKSNVPDRTDTPAVALGPTALVLGIISALGAMPELMVVLFPWDVIAGGLAVTFGAVGIHYARNGTGRLWSAIAGITLGAIGFAGVIFWLS